MIGAIVKSASKHPSVVLVEYGYNIKRAIWIAWVYKKTGAVQRITGALSDMAKFLEPYRAEGIVVNVKPLKLRVNGAGISNQFPRSSRKTWIGDKIKNEKGAVL